MKKTINLLLLAIITACTPQPEKTDESSVRQAKKYTIDQFYKNITYYDGSFSKDEQKLLVTSNESGIFNLYALPVNESGQKMLTQSTIESLFAISYFPDDDRILYSADMGGNEIDHIFLLQEDGSSKDITPWDNAKSNFFGWAHDQQSFFYTTNKRDPKYFDLYEMDIRDFKPQLIYENKDGKDAQAISKNKRFLALSRSITTSNNEFYLYDLEMQKLTQISMHEGDAQYNAQFFDLGNEYLFYLTNEKSDFMYLIKYNLDSGRKEKVWGTNWDVWYAYNSYNEKYRVIGVNEDGKTIINVVDLSTRDNIGLPDFGETDITGVEISKSEQLMRLTVGSGSSPNDIYCYNFATKELKKLTESLNSEINQEDLVAGRVVRFVSFDGISIPAIYYQPHGASPGNKVPALVWVHGGPGGQSRLSYNSLIQFLVNHDYAILAVNNRGSSGYGKEFNKMDDRKHGDVDMKDCIYGKNFLTGTGVIDTEKIGIIGGSYGGYMTMAALTFAPDEFAAGVNIFGVTNWLRTLKSIPPYWESFRKALYAEMGDPGTIDSVMLYNTSPLFHAKKVRKPLIVLQGANDPRVLQAESDEIVKAVKGNGVPVEYLLFEDEGHGFVKKENEIEGYGKILEFLDKYLKGTK
jgi:dipeptidyl aminopeptidase/acylaminoacyl peptidase